MSANDSLKIIQGLYEKGYVTYPRTNTEYLADAEKDKVQKIIDIIDKDNILEMIELFWCSLKKLLTKFIK